jgi:membrane-associated phospholipid phosphatase
MEVYDISKTLTPEQINIAVFWDDNPNVAHLNGHAAYFAQKMTPGGHWLAIVGAIMKSKNSNVMQTTYASLVLADAFITCWHYKYKFNTVRPITCINEWKDPKWFSYIQTPPFPEYPSGHSTISGAVSTLLTKLLGDSIAFTDSSELAYDLPVRSFKSFNDAANEVSVSRVYGGIHYRFTCDSSLALGREIGNYYIEKLGIEK